MNAAKRDTMLEFQRATVVRGGLGTKAPSGWTAVARRLGSVRWGTSAERREAAVESAAQAATFRCLADGMTRTVTVRDRIVCAQQGVTLTFDVTGIAPVGRDEIEFTGTASREATT